MAMWSKQEWWVSLPIYIMLFTERLQARERLQVHLPHPLFLGYHTLDEHQPLCWHDPALTSLIQLPHLPVPDPLDHFMRLVCSTCNQVPFRIAICTKSNTAMYPKHATEMQECRYTWLPEMYLVPYSRSRKVEHHCFFPSNTCHKPMQNQLHPVQLQQ
jgi:hypothetical protein